MGTGPLDLARTEQQLDALHSRDTRESLADAQMLQLENEALALVLEAMRQAYQAETDIEIPEYKGEDHAD